MPLREFVDERGRHWMVWDVYPMRMLAGWLAFEAEDGERRRLSPIPPQGQLAEVVEQQLREWCALAEESPRTRSLLE